MAHLQVLHVEDDILDSKSIRRWLSGSSHSFHLDQAETLAMGLTFGRRKNYDVVLLDLSLPDCYGPDALRKMRKHFPSWPIIVVTGNIDQQQAEAFVDIGADDYLFKGELNASTLWKSMIYSVRKKKLEQQLHQKACELKIVTELERRANSSKSEFLAGVSHDLRTPLGVILGYAEILESFPGIPEGALEYIYLIKRNSLSLVDLVNDLLDLCKVETGHMEIHLKSANLPNELREVFANYIFKAKQKNIDFCTHYSSLLPKIACFDQLRTRQILDNIISNAIKFTESGTVLVDISASDQSSKPSIVFDIKDTGPGISVAVKEKIFEPFQQAGSEINYKYGGTGLGLALARKLATALGGRVELLETQLELGSTFRCILPIECAEGVEWLDPNQEQSHDRSVIRQKDDATESGKPRHRILIAEDNADVQLMVKLFLAKSDFDLDMAGNGQEALEKALENSYDVILMDMQMPVKSGYEATRELRAKQYRRPIVALTAFAEISEKERCLKAGCDAYLSKPFTRQKLIGKLNKILTQPQIFGA